MEQSKKTIFEQLSVVYRRKWLFLSPLLAGAAISAIVANAMPEKYTSKTTVLSEDQQVPAAYVGTAETTPFNQRLTVLSQQILSRTNLERLAREFNLAEEESGPFDRALAAISRLLSKQDGPEIVADPVLDQIRNNVRFEVLGDYNPKKGIPPGNNMFTIAYSGPDPKKTMEITNAIASLFIEENMKSKEEVAEETSEFLTSELERSRAELSEYERALKRFKETNMGSLPEQLDANMRTLDRLHGELHNVEANIQNAEARRRVLEEQLEAAVPASGKSTDPVAAELNKLKSELTLLQSMYKDTYPDIIFTKKRIRDLEEELKSHPEQKAVRNPAVYAELSAIKPQLDILRKREGEIKRQIRESERRIEQTPSNEQRLTDLQRDYKISMENYQALLGKRLNAKVTENMEKKQKGGRFRVVDQAYIPLEPDEPQKLTVTGIGALGGGIMGLGLAFLAEMMSPAFRRPEEFEGIIEAPVLTSIPFVQEGRGRHNNMTVIEGRKGKA